MCREVVLVNDLRSSCRFCTFYPPLPRLPPPRLLTLAQADSPYPKLIQRLPRPGFLILYDCGGSSLSWTASSDGHPATRGAPTAVSDV